MHIKHYVVEVRFLTIPQCYICCLLVFHLHRVLILVHFHFFLVLSRRLNRLWFIYVSRCILFLCSPVVHIIVYNLWKSPILRYFFLHTRYTSIIDRSCLVSEIILKFIALDFSLEF